MSDNVLEEVVLKEKKNEGRKKILFLHTLRYLHNECEAKPQKF